MYRGFSRCYSGRTSLCTTVVQLFLQMGKDLDYEFVYIAPQELMLQYFYVSFLFGICVTIPVLLYQAWAFIRPGLKKSENFLFLIAMVFGLLCFCTGAIFAYKIMLPFMLYFFNTLSIGSWSQRIYQCTELSVLPSDGADHIWNCI